MNNFPAFYNPEQIGSLFYPDLAQIARDAEDAGLPSTREDRPKVHLVIIDMQVDFCHEDGSLYVPGALADIERLNAFILRHAGRLSKITCTLDSHLPFQIFHPAWWMDASGNHPDPMTTITYEDVENGRWQPMVMPGFSGDYVRRLEEQAKKQLTIWPYHVLIGGPGNQLDPSLWSVVMWHALARKRQPVWLVKGTVPQTEHYSAVQAEIPVKNRPFSGKNEAFLKSIASADYVIMAGEAASHCVQETLADIVAEFEDQPGVLDSIYVLQDCTSPVVHPKIDFAALSAERFAEFAGRGVHFVNSTEALPFLEPQGNTAVPSLQP